MVNSKVALYSLIALGASMAGGTNAFMPDYRNSTRNKQVVPRMTKKGIKNSNKGRKVR